MRMQVVAALESLSDPELQARWGHFEEGVSYYDDLTMNVNMLYDDALVLPEPGSAVPEILYPEEVAAFVELDSALGPLIRELGESGDDVYIRDRRWPRVMAAAAHALALMRLTGDVGHP